MQEWSVKLIGRLEHTLNGSTHFEVHNLSTTFANYNNINNNIGQQREATLRYSFRIKAI